MSVQEDNSAFVRRFVDYINNDPFAPVDEFFAVSYRYHNSSTPDVKDLTSLKNSTQPLTPPFPTSTSR
jgi:hypothetical protein